MIPTLGMIDATASFLERGFTFISWHCDEMGTEGFSTRLLGRPTTCLRGLEAATLVYEPSAFPRGDVIPRSAVHLLQDEHSVQTLEGKDHSHRKALFREIGDQHRSLGAVFAENLERSFATWGAKGRVVLYDELVLVLGRSALEWAGIDAPHVEVERVSRQLGEMVEQAGRFGPTNWIARSRRVRTEAWARHVVREEREAEGIGEPSPSHLVAMHRDRDGSLLSEPTAAVELLNVLRPVVANALFITFAVLALHEDPSVSDSLDGGEFGFFDVAQETRRLTPLFPMIGGTAQQDCRWHDETIVKGTRVLADLYGTNRHPDLWERPHLFDPGRFARDPTAASRLVPQGYGDIAVSHRCPGEDISLALIAAAVKIFHEAPWTVPIQDLSVDLSRMPALPKSGVVFRPL